MKIIFDSEEQRKKFFQLVPAMCCPFELELHQKQKNILDCEQTCCECWMLAGIDVEVKEENE